MSDKSSDEDAKKSAPPSRQNSQASIDSSCSSFEKIEAEVDAADTKLYAHTLPPIQLWGNEIVDTPDPDPRTVPIKPDQEQYYTGDSMRTALSNLILFSVLMFTAPFVAMYLSYHYIFLDYFGLSTADAMLDAGMVGVGTVFFIMAGFCYVAYKEEVEAEKEKFAREGGRGATKGGEEMEKEKFAREGGRGATKGGEEMEKEKEKEKEREGGTATEDAAPAFDDESKKDK